MKTQHQQKVEEFMRLASQELPTQPTIPSLEVRELRAKLILEEALETIEALGFYVCNDVATTRVDMRSIWLVQNDGPDLIEIIDGCADIKVVTTGTLSACGIPDDLFQNEVDDNNLAKFGEGHRLREDGKLIKSPNHQPPKIKELLESLS